MYGMDSSVGDAHYGVAGDIDHHGAPGNKGSVIVERQNRVRRLRVGKHRRIRDDNRAKSVAAAGLDHRNEQNQPQPEKPLHSNSVVEISLARNSLLYRERGREGKSSGARFSKALGSSPAPAACLRLILGWRGRYLF